MRRGPPEALTLTRSLIGANKAVFPVKWPHSPRPGTRTCPVTLGNIGSRTCLVTVGNTGSRTCPGHPDHPEEARTCHSQGPGGPTLGTLGSEGPEPAPVTLGNTGSRSCPITLGSQEPLPPHFPHSSVLDAQQLVTSVGPAYDALCHQGPSPAQGGSGTVTCVSPCGGPCPAGMSFLGHHRHHGAGVLLGCQSFDVELCVHGGGKASLAP
jgi:hypothetical protein